MITIGKGLSFLMRLALVAGLLLCLAAQATADQLSVPLELKNQLGVSRYEEPVTAGIPLPRSSNILSPGSLSMVDGTGNPVPCQFQVAARWGGSPADQSKPVKWVLATFLASAGPGQSVHYGLTSGSPQVPPAQVRVVSDTDQQLVVSTGAAEFTLDKKHFSLISTARVGQQTVVESPSEGIRLVDAQGQVYTSYNDAPALVTVEESGPVRLVVRVQGSLRDAVGTALLDYRAYLYFYAGKSYVRVLLTLGNHNRAAVGGSSYDVYNYYGQNSVTFEDLSVCLNLSPASGSLHYFFPGNSAPAAGALNSSLTIYQDSSGTEYWDRYGEPDHPRPNSYSRFRGYRALLGDSIIDSGDHFAGWLDVSGPDQGLTVGVVNFWQEFPKALQADSQGRIRLKLFPEDYAGQYNFRVGEEKTTELVLYFHTGDADQSQAADTAPALLKPMRPLIPFAWFSSSGAIQETVQAVDSSLLYGKLYDQFQGDQDRLSLQEMYDYYNDRTIFEDPQYNGPYSGYYPYHSLWESSARYPSSRDYFNYYGSLGCGYGNLPLDYEAYGTGQAGPFDNKYNLDYGAWLQFLRKGDFRWMEMAEALSRYAEQLMLHDVVTSTGWDVERWRNAVFGHAQHNETGNQNGQRNYLGPVLDTSFGASGALLHYYLTGYPVSKVFVGKLADYAYDFYMQDGIPRYTRPGRENLQGSDIRELANLLYHLTAGLLLTGDMKYQELAQGMIEFYSPEKQPWINGPPGTCDPYGYVSTWNLAMYLHAMGAYISALEEFGLTEDMHKAQSILVQYVDWLMEWGSNQYTSPADGRTYYGIYYNWYCDGSNQPQDIMFSNWQYMAADVYAYAYKYTRSLHYLEYARKLFDNACHNQGYAGDVLTYFTAKEAVNAAVYGHVYLYYAQEQGIPPEPEPNRPPVAQAGDDLVVEEGTLVRLDGTASWDPDGDELEFNWTQSPDDQVQVSLDDPYSATPQFLAPEVDTGQTLVMHFTLTVSDGTNQPASDTLRVEVVATQEPEPGEDYRFTLQDGLALPSGIVYQGTKDVYFRADVEGNYGASDQLIAYNSSAPAWRFLVKFDLSQITPPPGAVLESARLYLTRQQHSYSPSARVLYRVTHDWVEGTGTYGDTRDGVSWTTYDGTNSWDHPGADYDPVPVATSQVTQEGDQPGVEEYDVSPVVAGWLDGTQPNYGFLVTIPDQYMYSAAFYASSESEDRTSRPKLVITFTPSQQQNLVHNPEFDQDLQGWNTRFGQAQVQDEEGDNICQLSSGHVFQDIDLSQYREDINSGQMKLTVSGEMKADREDADDGYPYIRCLLIGTEEDPNRISVYLNTDYVSSSTWHKASASAVIPKGVNRVRLFLRKTSYLTAGVTNPSCYYDSISLNLETTSSP